MSIDVRERPVGTAEHGGEPHYVYPGTQVNLTLIRLATSGPWNEDRHWALFFLPMALIDVPLSLVLDTLLLPYDSFMVTFGGRTRYGQVQSEMDNQRADGEATRAATPCAPAPGPSSP